MWYDILGWIFTGFAVLVTLAYVALVMAVLFGCIDPPGLPRRTETVSERAAPSTATANEIDSTHTCQEVYYV